MKILLVDDHILFAKSLSIALCDNPEIEQFSSTKDIQDLEKQIATELPDILLIDINLGGLADEDGLMLTQHLLERFPDQKIVILSGYNLPVYRKEAKRIGARGFISKDVWGNTLPTGRSIYRRTDRRGEKSSRIGCIRSQAPRNC